MTTNTDNFLIGWKDWHYTDSIPKKAFAKMRPESDFEHGLLEDKRAKMKCTLVVQEKKAILDFLNNTQPGVVEMKMIIHFTDTTRTKISRIDTQLKGKKLLKNDPDAYWTNSNTLAKEENENAAEGERHKQETEVIKRSSVLATARKEKDDNTCKACNYRLEVNKKFIADCHHLHPVSGGITITNINDLVTLCPNCHRIAHTSGDPEKPFSIKKIQAHLRANGLKTASN